MAAHRFGVGVCFLVAGLSLNAATVSTPVAAPAGGKFNNATRVSLTCGTGQADSRYTFDGSEPTTSSKRYASAIDIVAPTILKVRAFKSGMTASASTSAKFEFVVATPTLSRAGGWFIGSVETRPSSKTDAATLRYTTDGSEPNASSKRYLGLTNFTFREKTTFKVKGFADNYVASPTASATYTPAIVVLLHGLNSDVSTWATLMYNVMMPRGADCPVATLTGNTPKANCYRYNFQSKVVAGTTWANGDGETFSELGTEVKTIVDRIAKANDPSLIVLVGHSRGGLAARAYVQSIPFVSTTPYKLALLTVGTPHAGSPLGRVKWWIDDNNKKYSVGNAPFKFLYSPSTGYLATWHSKATPTSARTPATWALNANVSALVRVSAFGEIVSGGLRLGENVYLRLNVFDGANLASWPLGIGKDELPKMKDYVFLDLPGDWGTDGDGVVPVAAQKLEAISGLPKSFSTLQTKLSRVAHVDETSEAAAILSILEKMLVVVPMPSTALRAPNNGADAEQSAFERQVSASAERLAEASSQALITEFQAAIEGEDRATLAVVSELLIRRGVDDTATVTAIRSAATVRGFPVTAELATVLGRIATPAAVSVLVDMLDRGDAHELVRMRAAQATAHLGTWVRASDAIAVSAVLMSALERARDDVAFSAFATGLADVGTRDGAVWLWQYSRTGVETRKDLAAAALQGPARSGDVISVLADELRVDPSLQSESSARAGQILSTIVSPESTRALLRWSRDTSPEQFALHGVPWLSNLRDRESFELVTEASESPELPVDRRAILQRVSRDRAREIEPHEVIATP
jgi:pimeloyl-ACP methyl ester carboxylesterase